MFNVKIIWYVRFFLNFVYYFTVRILLFSTVVIVHLKLKAYRAYLIYTISLQLLILSSSFHLPLPVSNQTEIPVLPL